MQYADPPPAELAVIAVDRAGVIASVRADGSSARLVEELHPGTPLVERIHPDDRDVASWALERAARDERPLTVELRWLRSDARSTKLLARFARDPNGAAEVALRYDDFGTLRRAEEQMRRVVEGSAQGIVVRTQTEVLYMNDSFARMVGFESARECIANAVNANAMIWAEDLPTVLKHLKARISGQETISNYEFRLVHRDGHTIWAETHAANVNWDGKSASLSWISDISRRKAMEEESRKSREAAEFANRTKTQFLANMSHELRTPLNAILGFSEMIQQQIFGPVGAKYLEYANDIHRSGRLLLDLVNDVLDLSKLEAGKLELRESAFDVSATVEDCLALVRKRAQDGAITLEWRRPDRLPLLRADQRAVKQLLLNFLTNAIKFTPEGGDVRVTVSIDEAGLALAVSDTGIGMTAAEIEVALSPFGQVDSKLARKHEGTGLGLPICRSLMELHGGALNVTSAPNAGTTLTARFPAVRIVSNAPVRKTANG